MRGDRVGRHARARDAVEAVAAGDEIAAQLLLDAVVPVAHERRVAVEAVQRDALGLVDRRPANVVAALHQVARDLGLAIHGHAAAREPLEVDAVQLVVEGELGTAVAQSFALEAYADAGVLQQLHRRLLKHAGADARQHVVGRALLEDHVVDPGFMQQLPEQQARRPGPDDRDLGTSPRR